MTLKTDKASRLFKFLSEVQKLREKPIREISTFEKNGSVFKLASFRNIVLDGAEELALNGSVCFPSEPHSEDEDSNWVLTIHRPSESVEWPEIPVTLDGMVTTSVQNPAKRPEIIKSNIPSDENEAQNALTDFENWIRDWQQWAHNKKIESLYEQLFELEVNVNQRSEEYELVLGIGHLNWATTETTLVDRPLFVTRLSIEREDHTGAINVLTIGDEIRFEGESLPPEEILDRNLFSKIEDATEGVNSHFLDHSTFEPLGQLVAAGLTTNSQYRGSLEVDKNLSYPILSWAPSIILRPRRKLGLAQGFAEISELIDQEERIPAGLEALIDSNDQTVFSGESTEGAVFTLAEEIFSPLPLNARQQKVLERVDSHAQTIVQGPPGTGKTHMAAALLSHLLAQGKRVLVTAETDRALYELRDKMPESVREHAVSVIDSGREELSQLRVSVDTINRRSDEFDPQDSQRRISELEAKLRALGEQRMEKIRRCSNRAQAEVEPILYQDTKLTLAEAIDRLELDREQFGWIEQLGDLVAGTPFPLNEVEAADWIELLNDAEVQNFGETRGAHGINTAQFPSAAEFESLLHECNLAKAAVKSVDRELDKTAQYQWIELRDDMKAEFVEAAKELRSTNPISSVNRPWIQLIEQAENKGELSQLRLLLGSVQQSLNGVKEIVLSSERLPRVEVNNPNFAAFAPLARSILQALNSGESIQLNANGSIKFPRFGKSVLRDSRSFFDNVRIEGSVPTNKFQVLDYLREVELRHRIGVLATRWNFCPFALRLPPRQLLEAFENDIAAFLQVLDDREARDSKIRKLHFSPIAFDVKNVQAYLSEIDKYERASVLEENLQNQVEELEKFKTGVRLLVRGHRDTAWVSSLANALDSHDVQAFRQSLEELHRFNSLVDRSQVAADLNSSVKKWSPAFFDKCVSDDTSDIWCSRASQMPRAQDWLRLKKLVENRNKDDVDELQSEINQLDQRMTAIVSEIAAGRAWSNAVGVSRIDSGMKRNLVAYTQAVKRLGKGTGKRSEETRRHIRRHLNACRGAVPVWIMPIYKVIEQFKLEENMFDVVIVDEASQAGLDAVFLQFLAARVVVIGDNKQVSPMSPGVNMEPISQLANQYIKDFEHRDVWQELTTSLFDIAEAVYGGRITLVEHRRSVPEIIGFSNEHVYRPDNVNLKPVREVESDRLAPFRVTHTPNAVRSEGKNKVNRDEADILVKRLIACLEDPAYDGKTFGVISLLSTSKQHEYIQACLLKALPADVWEERQLKVGTSAEFQGAERDVIFLTMVDSANSGSRSTAKTGTAHVQRYNVAVSRAKDQVWLFHSISEEDLNNPEDFRLKLQKYAYGVALAQPEDNRCVPVPDDELVDPFDSLFEQRVYNELVSRGYFVSTQVESMGYYIDLVVEGRDARLAIECDGDKWHGPAQLKRDQARQRVLERAGWKFVRIFESDFKLNRAYEIERVLETLEKQGVRPWESRSDDSIQAVNVEQIEYLHQPIEQDGDTEYSGDLSSLSKEATGN